MMKRLTTAICFFALAGSPAVFAQGGGYDAQQGGGAAQGQGQRGGAPQGGAPQGQGGAGQAAAPPQSADDFDKEELESFANAREKVQTIQQDYSQKLQEAEDPSKSRELQQQAQQEMVQAVQAEGLDASTYNQIVTAVQSNQELQKKVEDLQ